VRIQICLLDVLKNDFEDDEAMFQGVERPTPHFLRSGSLKKRLGRIRLSDVLSRRMALTTQNQPSGGLKNQLL
jgi:hypothetical protein